MNPAGSIGSIRSALKSLEVGMPLVIFPEGGRTPDGLIKPLPRGRASFLAIKAQVDVVPVALIGTYKLLPMNTLSHQMSPLSKCGSARLHLHRRSDRSQRSQALSEKVSKP